MTKWFKPRANQDAEAAKRDLELVRGLLTAEVEGIRHKVNLINARQDTAHVD
jgi:hypothetical protein